MKRFFLTLLVICVAGIGGHSVQAEGSRYLLYEDFTDFLSAVIPDDWAIIDANEDFTSWHAVEWGGARGGPSARYLSSPTEAADDWLVAAPLNLEPGVNYTVSFHARVTDASRPHNLRVVVGQSPGAGAEITQFSSISNMMPEAFEADFSVDTPGVYYIQFHCTTPADSLALYLSRIIVSQPENDLEVVLQLDANASDPETSAVFGANEEIGSLIFVRNNGEASMTLNSRMNVRDENDPDSTLAFRIIDPDGEPVPFQGRIREARPFPGDFREIGPTEIIHKFFNFNEGFYDLSLPGEYTVRAVYKNIHLPEAGSAWRGKLVSDPVTFTIE